MVNDGDLVAIFHSVHRVMQAEKALKQARCEMLLIPVPRQLSSDCGLAIRFPGSLKAEVLQALQGAGLEPSELYRREGGQFESESNETA
ncbi:MAG: hypothetical protein C0616_07630 [Desulfuromonas sp.]|nr:MAG: hypothetical protein C0616_07630 [Desulfuromonas sp.]